MAPSNTWSETDPAGSSLRSLGDDSIRQFKLDLRERLAAEHVSGDGTVIEAADFTEARHKLSSIGLLGLLKGLRIEQRTYATSGNITISGRLQIEINGDMCYLNSDTNLAFSGLTASTSYYIYVASPGHETELVAGNLSYSTTVPTYSTSKKGWYSGTSRAIGFFRSAVGSYMIPFIQTQFKYRYMYDTLSGLVILSSGTATSYTEITSAANLIPVFCGSICILEVLFDPSTALATGTVTLSGRGVTSQVDTRIEFTYPSGSSSNGLIVQADCSLSSNRTIYYYSSSSNLAIRLGVIGFDLDGSL